MSSGWNRKFCLFSWKEGSLKVSQVVLVRTALSVFSHQTEFIISFPSNSPLIAIAVILKMSSKGISLRSSYFICHKSISIKKIWLYRLKPTNLTHTWKNANNVAYTCHVNSEIWCTRSYAQSRSNVVCYWKMVQKPWIIYRKSGRNSFLLLPGGLTSKIHATAHLCLI